MIVNSKKNIIIFGAGNFAQVAYVYLSKDSPFTVAAFTVSEKCFEKPYLMGLPVLKFESLLESHPPDVYAMFVAIAYSKRNRERTAIYHECKKQGYELISYVNSKATHWGEIEIGDNCFIFENNVIQPFVKIGNNVILWSGNHIGHHSTIGHHCFIASHAVISGNCRIQDGCFIGVNATLRDGINVARNCIIGAGALILSDTVEDGVYKGSETLLNSISSKL